MLETIRIGDQPKLEAIREGAGSPCAVIAHPHPLYGGDMYNNVVVTARDAALAHGFSALRFNFRGVGRSEGVHDQGQGEVRDFETAVTAAGADPVIIAYSFGAWVAAALIAERPLPAILIAPPTAMFSFPDVKEAETWVIVGAADPFCNQKALLEQIPPERLTVVHGIDHFWFGRENVLRSHLDRLLPELKAAAGRGAPGEK
jgi:alpha/beta superfamily hydrolase